MQEDHATDPIGRDALLRNMRYGSQRSQTDVASNGLLLGRFKDVECRIGDVVAFGEPRLAFRITMLPSERQQSAVDAALELLPPSSVRNSLCLRYLSGA